MKNTVFIQTNNQQMLGAMVAKYAIESKLTERDTIEVQYINVDELKSFKDFVGTKYIFSGTECRTYTNKDLQSFTLSRFMPPALMGYAGKALVIDPDIFALTDIRSLFDRDMNGAAVLACRKKDAWDTSVMVMDCSQLAHWNIENILTSLKDHTAPYTDIITLRKETAPIGELPRIWNSLDEYTPETKMIHMTGRLTQPWKTGLPIDFTRNKMKKIFGILPREPFLVLLGKYPTHYQPHPNKMIEELFLNLLKSAVKDGAISETVIAYEIEQKHVRGDIFDIISV